MPELTLQAGGAHCAEQAKQRKKCEGAWHAWGIGRNQKWLEYRMIGDKTGKAERDRVNFCAMLRRLYLTLKSTRADKWLHTVKCHD